MQAIGNATDVELEIDVGVKDVASEAAVSLDPPSLEVDTGLTFFAEAKAKAVVTLPEQTHGAARSFCIPMDVATVTCEHSTPY